MSNAVKTGVAEAENLIQRISQARSSFSRHANEIYKESEVILRSDTIRNLLSILLNDAITMKKEWENAISKE